MKKIRLAGLLLTTLMCTGCNFYEVEEEVSSAETISEISEPKEISVNSEPVSYVPNTNPDAVVGEKIIDTFSTKGLDGKTYNQSMFAGKLTLINMWGTYCSPCISEMPHLARVHKKYEESDFQVVGILIDITDSSGNINSTKKAKADSIVTNAGVTYTSILPCSGLANFINSTEYIPFSVFIDENGNQLGESITGSMDYSNWDKLVKSMLYTYMY